MVPFPRPPEIDGTLAFLLEGYDYPGKRFRTLRTDVFETRFLGKPAIFMMGEEAARLFYEDMLFARGRAAPLRVQKTLMGKGALQTLDGAAHARRKALFQSLLEPARVARMVRIAYAHWTLGLAEWAGRDALALMPAAAEVLCRTACEWAGVPLDEGEAAARTRDFLAMIDAPGAVGPRHWRGRLARARAEAWIEGLIGKVRRFRLIPPEGSALEAWAGYRNPNGTLLPARAAAVEMLNLLRPVAAVSNFIGFSALALHRHPDWRLRLREDFAGLAGPFAQEVRRFYPFFPIVGARVRREFAWRGHVFPAGALAFLDLYGTDHDPRLWTRPERFDPDRFRNGPVTAFAFIPQGGGDPDRGHRCPGELATVELMKVALDFLVNGMRFEVPSQDLTYSLSRIPAVPKSRFVIRNIVPLPGGLQGIPGVRPALERNFT